MTKEFGNLTPDQYRELLEFVPKMAAMTRSMNSHIASVPTPKFDSVMPGDYGL